MSGESSQRRIFLASFMTLIAAGVGFGIRGAVLADWAGQFGFTKTELGVITGSGLAGFGFTIIFFSLFTDKVGYRALMLGAFILHALSGLVTVAATPIFDAFNAAGNPEGGRTGVYWCLYVGTFTFSLANGLCETVINPLVATLYPKRKTHYLNILHAGWPGGLIVGGLLAFAFVGDDAAVFRLRWEIPMLFFLAPTLWYGAVTLMEKFPVSEARAAGLTFFDMLKEFAAPLLLFLLLIHAMVGYVELGTDSWITNIMKNVIAGKELLLFVYTSAIMFVLRFFAGPIVERINPLGLLFLSACLGCLGLYALGGSSTGLAIVLSATVYGLGKTFFWPTMLGVVGERFPRGGALTMGTMGGIGMLSAGLLGGPGIGYTQDYYASQDLKRQSPAVYDRFVSSEKNRFLLFPEISGLDGAKVDAAKEKLEDSKKKVATLSTTDPERQIVNKEIKTLTEENNAISDAGIFGGRMALKVTAIIPATMAVCYLLLIGYFAAIGGYKTIEITGGQPHESRFAPTAEDAIELGTQGPGQA